LEHRVRSSIFDFVVEHRMVDGVAVLGVHGEADLAKARALSDELATVAGRPLVIDLCACTFIDSTTIG
jgi:anti-anti-sigma regulatory factor